MYICTVYDKENPENTLKKEPTTAQREFFFFLTANFNRVNQSDHNTVIFTFSIFFREVGGRELAFMASP